jgi:monofunctional biosynthetic peptidoglycan transglycosylase
MQDPEKPQDEPEDAHPPEGAAEASPEAAAPVEPELALEPEPEPEPEPPPTVIAPPPAPPRPPYRPPPRREPPARLAARPRTKGGWLRRLVVWTLLIFVAAPVGLTLIYRFAPPPITILMVERLFQGHGLDRRWRALDDMSPALPRAVIAAEDARFCEHHGFDFEAMEKAYAANQRRPGKIRGGSTISQQTAKNIFLWPQRSYVRKVAEAGFTVLIEGLWGKRRIMEVYLNSVEWGPGVYGAEAAARRNFGVGADKLTPAQAARLAAILPSPLKWRAAAPGPYVKKRSRRIGAASGTVRREGLADCVFR